MSAKNKPSLSDQLRTISAFLGGSGVALGAYGAHGLVPKIALPTSTSSSNGMMDQWFAANLLKENWKTAVTYQLIHAVSILTIAAIVECKEQRQRQVNNRMVSPSSTLPVTMLHRAGQVMAVGTTLFSGSIYLLCLNIGPKYIWGPITPMGGMLIIAGWVMLLCNDNNNNDNDKSDEKDS